MRQPPAWSLAQFYGGGGNVGSTYTHDFVELFNGLTSRCARTAAREPGRLGQPEDVARAVLFLCSELSRHVTGQLLRVDGGQLIG